MTDPFAALRRRTIRAVFLLPVGWLVLAAALRLSGAPTRASEPTFVLKGLLLCLAWAGGVAVAVLPRAKPRGLRQPGGVLVRYAPWRRAVGALQVWPLLAMASGGARGLMIGMVLFVLVGSSVLWVVYGARTLIGPAGLWWPSSLGRGKEFAWGEVASVRVLEHQIVVTATDGRWAGVNAMAQDGGPELAAELLRRVPTAAGEHRPALEAIGRLADEAR